MARKPLLERIADARRPQQLAWSVGRGAVIGPETRYGHDQSEFSPDKYGDYLATSNEVYSAAALRARLMSGLRLKLYRGRDSSKREIADGAAPRLLQRVNPFWTFPRLIRMDEMCMSVFGESTWAIEKRGGWPVEIWWMKPSRVRPVADESNYLKGFLYESVSGELIPFRPDEVAWFRYPNPIDEFSPLSPLAAARLAADTASSMMQANRNLHSQGLQLGGLIIPATDKATFSPEQADELEELLEQRWSKVENARRWAVLRYEAQFKEMTLSPKDAQFVDGLNLTLRQVANVYGIPVPLMNDLSAATLANVREYQRQLWEHALVPDAELRAADIVEQVLSRFPQRRDTPDHAEFDFSRVPALQESASEAWTREGQQIDRGAITINEWRKSKGMPPVSWGNVYWAPVNKAPVSSPEDNPSDNPDAPNLTPEEALEIAEARGGNQQRAPYGRALAAELGRGGDGVDAAQASRALAALDMAALEFRHGRLSLNGHRKVGS